jgi:hypothetical protein
LDGRSDRPNCGLGHFDILFNRARTGSNRTNHHALPAKPEVRPQLGSEEWNYLGELAEAREELERMIGEYGEPGSSGKTSPFGRSSFVVLKGGTAGLDR